MLLGEMLQISRWAEMNINLDHNSKFSRDITKASVMLIYHSSYQCMSGDMVKFR